jgi:hypothetical protein
MVDGQVLVCDFALTQLDGAEVAASARQAARALLTRAGL